MSNDSRTRMAFSIKHLMLFVTVMAVALTISRYFPPYLAMAVVGGAGLLVLPLLQRDQRRPYAWGALSGVVIAIIAIPLIATFFGYYNSRSNENQVYLLLSYGVSIGWVLGATIGLFSNAWKKSKTQE